MTLLGSVIVVGLLGVLLLNRVTTGLLENTQRAGAGPGDRGSHRRAAHPRRRRHRTHATQCRQPRRHGRRGPGHPRRAARPLRRAAARLAAAGARRGARARDQPGRGDQRARLPARHDRLLDEPGLDLHRDPLPRRADRARPGGGRAADRPRGRGVRAVLPVPARSGGGHPRPRAAGVAITGLLLVLGARAARLGGDPAGGRPGAGRGTHRGALLGGQAHRAHGGEGGGRPRRAGDVVQPDGGVPAGPDHGAWRRSRGCSSGSCPTSRTSCGPR